MRKKIWALVLICFIVLSSNYTVFAAFSDNKNASIVTKAPGMVTITSISSIATAEIKQNDKYALPQMVTANMSDGTKKNVNIIWNAYLDTSRIGLNKFEGKVDGFSTPIKFNVLVRGLDLSAPQKVYNKKAKIGDIVGITGSMSGISYDHFGIYIGNGDVIEYSSPTGKIQDAAVLLKPMNISFTSGKYFIYQLKDLKFTPDIVVKRAISRLFEGKYDLIGNNCENFAVWCQTGVSKSFQIDSHSISDIELLDRMINSPLINIK